MSKSYDASYTHQISYAHLEIYNVYVSGKSRQSRKQKKFITASCQSISLAVAQVMILSAVFKVHEFEGLKWIVYSGVDLKEIHQAHQLLISVHCTDHLLKSICVELIPGS